jgi:hypothetical protein
MLAGVEKRKIDISPLALPNDRGHLDDLRPCANNNTDHMIVRISFQWILVHGAMVGFVRNDCPKAWI